LKEEALDRTMWRNRFRGGFGPVVRQNTEWMMNTCWVASLPVRQGGSRYELHGPGGSWGDPQPNYVAYVFAFLSTIIVCQLYTLTLSYQAQVSLQLKVSPKIQRKNL